MALIKCPECGKEISDKSINCIHCGYPLKNNSITENVNGIDYDISVLFEKPRSRVQQIKIVVDLCHCGLIQAKDIVLKYNPPCIVNDEENTIKCPKCGSTQIQMVPRKWSLLTGFMTNKVDRVCMNCKNKF